jgi:hypothetical protein
VVVVRVVAPAAGAAIRRPRRRPRARHPRHRLGPQQQQRGVKELQSLPRLGQALPAVWGHLASVVAPTLLSPQHPVAALGCLRSSSHAAAANQACRVGARQVPSQRGGALCLLSLLPLLCWHGLLWWLGPKMLPSVTRLQQHAPGEHSGP